LHIKRRGYKESFRNGRRGWGGEGDPDAREWRKRAQTRQDGGKDFSVSPQVSVSNDKH